MESDNIIRTFTAVDIEKYHKGQLSAKEMHDLEKAALDDPFLADALEGYAVPGVDVAADIAELKKRLSDKIEKDNKVIPLATPRSSFPWLRAAAMIVLVAGAGLLVYKFGFSDKSQQIAQAPKEIATENKDKEAAIASSDSLSITSGTGNSTYIMPDTIKSGAYSWKKVDIAPPKGDNTLNATAGRLKESKDADGDGITDSTLFLNYNALTKQNEEANQKAPAPAIVEKEETAAKKVGADDDRLRQLYAKERKAKAADNNYKPLSDSLVASGNGYLAQDKMPQRKAGNTNNFSEPGVADNNRINNQYRANVFRGQVTDAHNNPLPFANITNTADNIGTYSDAKGNFVLTSPDSVLNVQIRSLGFDNNNTLLKPQAPGNRVVMQEDRSSLAEVVVSNKRVNSNRSRNSNMVLEEPEPIDGWINYDTYIANNLNVPETLKSRQADGGEVQLSFEVNNKGEPVNITVDKSLCDSCDKEAIRLVKEGPKWKRKSRKGRTSVTISF